jgi:2-hydroxychromene-2-carboxylate isomerase
MSKRVEFFYDIGSPYTYMAATQIDAIGKRHGAEVVWRPFLLGGVFKAVGNEMPARVAAKARHMLQDLMRWARHYDVPFQFSGRFPQNGLRAMRACTFAEQKGKSREFGMAVFKAYWVDDQDITSDETLSACARAAGLDAKELLAACDSPAVKDQLRKNTDEAVARGAFGAPTIFIGEQMFWGNDRLVFVEDALK